MGTYEATNVVLTKINNLDPEKTSKMIGHILVNLQDTGLVRLASSPDYVIYSLVLRVKTLLGLSSTPSSPNPIPRSPTTTNPFSRFNGNASSPSSHAWSLSELPNNPISSKSSPLLSHDNIHVASVSKSSLSPRVMVGDCDTVRDFVEQEVGEYFSFLNESLKDQDLVDPRLELGHGTHNWHSVVNNGDPHFHIRSHSARDVCFGSEEIGGYKPCVYFPRGFCKNGGNCKFLHSALTDLVAAIVGSPSKFQGLEQHEEIIRLKAAQHQRLMAASQLMAGASPSSYDKYINFLMQQQNDPQRAAAATVMMRDEFYKLGRFRPERNDF